MPLTDKSSGMWGFCIQVFSRWRYDTREQAVACWSQPWPSGASADSGSSSHNLWEQNHEPLWCWAMPLTAWLSHLLVTSNLHSIQYFSYTKQNYCWQSYQYTPTEADDGDNDNKNSDQTASDNNRCNTQTHKHTHTYIRWIDNVPKSTLNSRSGSYPGPGKCLQSLQSTASDALKCNFNPLIVMHRTYPALQLYCSRHVPEIPALRQ